MAIAWDKQKLQPVIITYNRAPYLQRTLTAWAKAGLTNMRLHILDNSSTDGTKAVVQAFQQDWPELIYHCNHYNIGGNANILRALELSDAVYHWVIGDDDEWTWDAENLAELKKIVEKGEADVIRLGWLVSAASRGKCVIAHSLIENEHMFFASLSMISATIAKRELWVKHLPWAYHNIPDAYPQLIPFIREVERAPLKVYSLSKDLMNPYP